MRRGIFVFHFLGKFFRPAARLFLNPTFSDVHDEQPRSRFAISRLQRALGQSVGDEPPQGPRHTIVERQRGEHSVAGELSATGRLERQALPLLPVAPLLGERAIQQWAFPQAEQGGALRTADDGEFAFAIGPRLTPVLGDAEGGVFVKALLQENCSVL